VVGIRENARFNAGMVIVKPVIVLFVIAVAAMLTGITSVLLVMMLSQPRVLLAMARDGLHPARPSSARSMTSSGHRGSRSS
jgi:amino acid transporter